MPNNLFYSLGYNIFRFRRWIIVSWIIAILLCLPCLPKLMVPFTSGGFENFNSESALTLTYIQKKIGYQKHRVLFLFSKKSSKTSDEQFRHDVDKALKGLKNLDEKHEVLVGPIQHDKNILAVLAFKNSSDFNTQNLEDIKSYVTLTKRIRVKFGGEDVFLNSINKQTQKDLYRADIVATPVTVFTLLMVFGSVAAAIMPLFVGASCAVIMLGLLHWIAYHTSLSIFTINIAMLLGLCLSLDYALFIISRFREELDEKQSHQEAIAMTIETAGKAVFFSGLAVFASLSALVLFPINILVSVGIGGLCAVMLAVIGALTLLPAILSCINSGINFGTIFKTNMKESHFWRKIATKVVNMPYLFVFLGLVVLVICSLQVRGIKLGIYDYHILPKQSEGRDFFNAFTKEYDESELSPILVVIHSHSNILNEKNIERAYHLMTKIKKMDAIDSVSGYLNWIPKGKLEAYKTLYTSDKERLPEPVKQILMTSTSKHDAILYVQSKYSSESEKTQKLIRELRDLIVSGLSIKITGGPANNFDVFTGIYQKMPYAVAMILGMTFLVLMLLLKSLFLPFKAILMNILSLLATYGTLVFVFQKGDFHHLLNFDPQGFLDISMLVIIFCALFGFSMDYEVFLLTRIHEYYLRSGDNEKSIIFGMEHSAKIITSAAWIVIVLCSSFLIADVLIVKAFGFGVAIAILIDAFIIRIFLVPAIMTLTRKINWYLPRFLK